jgi:hypothetical protein
MALVGAGVGIEDDDSTVAIAIGDIRLIRRWIGEDLRGLPEVLNVVAPVVHAVFSELQKELTVAVELENLGVLRSVSCEPDVAFVIHRDSMVAVGPVVAFAGAAPRFDQIPGLVENEDWRGHFAALSERKIPGLHVGGFKVVLNAPGSVYGPHVILSVNGETNGRARDPVIRQWPGPEGIDLEHRRLLGTPLRSYRSIDGRGIQARTSRECG